MSKFLDSQSSRICAEVNRTARRLGYLGKKEDVDCDIFGVSDIRWVTFTAGVRESTVAIAETNQEIPDADHVVFPCGDHLDDLVKKTAQSVVISLFEPSGLES